MRAEALLVWNLADQEYVNLVLAGSLDHLPAIMAKHWPIAQAIRKERRAPATNHPMPTTKKQIRNPQLLDNLKETVKKMIELISQKAQAA